MDMGGPLAGAPPKFLKNISGFKLNIFPMSFTDKPVSRRPKVEVAGEVGEAGVEVARDQLAVSGWSGGGQRGHHGGHT